VEVAGTRRVLRSDLNFPQKTLLLLYSSTDPALLVEDLFEWTKYSDLSLYKVNLLKVLDRGNLVHYDVKNGTLTISPLGIKEVEEKILKQSLA
jgi:hypothetical protein